MTLTIRELLADATYTRAEIDRFLDPNRRNWAAFDPELGYRLRDCVMRDGIDGSFTVAHYLPSGERRMINYAEQPCRINTYGDSFTQCHQVSDGETWQEYLAAHLGEPTRNFGVGGYGVYQAYRRMLREEATPRAAEYVVLNIYDDDHFRSLDAWRWLRIGRWRQWFRSSDQVMFHNNPWAHVRIDAQTGQVVERENPYPTPESLYQLSDPGHVYEAFRDDLVVQFIVAQHGAGTANLEPLQRLAEVLGVPCDMSTPEAQRSAPSALHIECALRASQWIVERADAFARRSGRKLIILLSYSGRNVVAACEGRPRFDQAFVDWLREKRILFVDAWQKHNEDFASFNLSPEAYVRRYYNGHYSPAGNHFFAFAIKDALVGWLDPKPVCYRRHGESYAELAAALA